LVASVGLQTPVATTYHVEYILPKLSTARYAVRIIKPYISLEKLKIVHLI